MRPMPADYYISRADAADIDALITVDFRAGELFIGTGVISEDALNDHVPADVFAEAIAARHVFVARDTYGAVAGFTLTSPRGDTLYLDQISVDPAHGQKGIGAALMKRIMQDAKERKVRAVTLSTFIHLPWNGPFYKKLGFKPVKDSNLTDWMKEIAEAQAPDLDMSKRCFMQRKTGWW